VEPASNPSTRSAGGIFDRTLSDRAPWALLAAAFLYVAALTAFSYKQDLPFEDVLWDANNARALLTSGAIPSHGDVNSFFAYNPPGISWGFVPGLIVFPTEIALAEKASALILLALTLLGIYWLCARWMGSGAVVFVCLAFLLSDRGLFFAGSLWPRAHPVFLVWMLYFMDRWITKHRPWALTSALILCLAADYWMLEGITAIVVIPVVWLAFRPKVRWREVALAAGAGLLIWSPYLAFELSRGFVDLRGTLTRTSMITENYDVATARILYNHNLKRTENRRAHQVEGITATPEPAAGTPEYRWVVGHSESSTPEWIYQAVNETVEKGVRGRWTWAKSDGGWRFKPSDAERANPASAGVREFSGCWKRILASMPDSRVPSGQGIVLFLVASGILWGFRGGFPGVAKTVRILAFLKLGAAAALTGTAVVAFGALAALALKRDEFYSVIVFCLLSLGFLAISQWWPTRLLQPTKAADSPALRFTLAAAAFFPWVIALALVLHDPGTDLSRRFLWLWPIQGILVVAMLRNIRWPSAVRVWAICCFLFVVTWNADLVYRTVHWRQGGFGFAPADEANQALNFLGNRIKREGRNSAGVGYDLAFNLWPLLCHTVDGVSKVGMSYDEILRMRYGIVNLDTAAEGIRTDDEFRIVERSSSDSAHQTYFDLSVYPRLAVIYQNSSFIVLGPASRQ
jgi:hypothetical protein